jgi:lactoylglutathione lyase
MQTWLWLKAKSAFSQASSEGPESFRLVLPVEVLDTLHQHAQILLTTNIPGIVKFYEFLGMSLIKHLRFPEAKFDLYFLAYDSPKALSSGNSAFDREGVIELTHNYGTEDDDSYTINNGNKEPHRGFGHVCISVDYIQAACRRIEDAGYKFQKKLADGRMKHIAFALDPDGYWVEIVSLKAGTKGADDPNEPKEASATDPTTYRMVFSSPLHRLDLFWSC